MTSIVQVFAGTKAGDFETDDAAGEPVCSGSGAAGPGMGSPASQIPQTSEAGTGGDFEGFLENGLLLASALRRGADLPSVTETLPALGEHALEAWPGE